MSKLGNNKFNNNPDKIRYRIPKTWLIMNQI